MSSLPTSRHPAHCRTRGRDNQPGKWPRYRQPPRGCGYRFLLWLCGPGQYHTGIEYIAGPAHSPASLRSWTAHAIRVYALVLPCMTGSVPGPNCCAQYFPGCLGPYKDWVRLR